MRFFSTLVAATLGTLVALGIVFFFFFLIIVALASSGDSKPRVASGSMVVLEIEGSIPEIAADDPFAQAFGKQPLDLARIRQALRMAAADERVDAVWLKVGMVGTPWATLEEIRGALLDYQQSGKRLYASASSPYLDEAGYFLASAADTVVMQPLTIFEFNGFTLTAEFYKRLLDKLDVKPQVVRVGSFKGAVEPFIREDLSPENREQLASLLAEQNRVFLSAVAESRRTTPEALQSLIETNAVFSAEGGLQAGLLDALMLPDEFEALLKRRTGVAQDKDLKLLDARDYAATSASDAGIKVAKGDGEIAIVYAVGGIVDGESGTSVNPLMGGTVVGDRTFRKAMKEARENDRVKAVVLRINSPGGSASASEAMRREIILTRAEKPVIVSMGDYAASGGYWIATGSDHIVSDPLTITGSIGVFNLFFNIGGLLENKVGITFDQLETSPFADLASGVTPLTAPQEALLQQSVDYTYRMFVEHVSTATGLDTARVHEIAQGRVWTGAQARELGLVHELGGIRRALEVAAERAGIEGEAYRVRVLPRPKTTLERFLEGMGAQAQAWVAARQSPTERALRERAATLDALMQQNGQVQALLPARFEVR